METTNITNSNEMVEVEGNSSTHNTTIGYWSDSTTAEVPTNLTKFGVRPSVTATIAALSAALVLLLVAMLLNVKLKKKAQVQADVTNLTELEKLANEKLTYEFLPKVLLGDAKRRGKMINRYHKQPRDSVWTTKGSASTSRNGSLDDDEYSESIFEREIVYHEEEAKKAFYQLVGRSPIVYSWIGHAKQQEMDAVDQAEFEEFQNMFDKPSLQKDPSALSDYKKEIEK